MRSIRIWMPKCWTRSAGSQASKSLSSGALLSDPWPLLGAQPVDLALDLKQLIDPTDRFQRNR
jgi:hypothetical protein